MSVANARKSGWQKSVEEPEEKLLRCIRKIVAINKSRKTEEKIQSMLLEWLVPPQMPKRAKPVNVRRRIEQRKHFWASFRDPCYKWEAAPVQSRAGHQTQQGRPQSKQLIRDASCFGWNNEWDKPQNWRKQVDCVDVKDASAYCTLRCFRPEREDLNALHSHGPTPRAKPVTLTEVVRKLSNDSASHPTLPPLFLKEGYEKLASL